MSKKQAPVKKNQTIELSFEDITHDGNGVGKINGYPIFVSNTLPGETAKVKKLHGEGALRRRIMDMGITKGVEVYIRKVAPLGDPMEVTVRGYELSLRKADAEMIETM